MQVTVHDAISAVSADDWNRLAGCDCPFLKHEFLCAIEDSDSASTRTGWTPQHITISRNNEIVAALPLYEKDHSWGEFVFDWSWAQAYERAGFDYYPKLVSAIPFTPAPSRRLLLADPSDPDLANALIASAISLAGEAECSSLHLLFPHTDELPKLRAAGLKLRKDCQFHWHNHDYRDFDHFLGSFSSRKRKKVRQDRRRVFDAGIRLRRVHGDQLDLETWHTIYKLISITFMRRGSLPYLTLDFFTRICLTLPENLLVIIAEKDNVIIAAAVFFESDTVLYGRYWGSDGQFDALHFETCYYQGIEYCIEAGKKLFEPGTQGEHKISRGFVPVETWSAHWLAHPEFFSAIGNYLDEESRHVKRYMDAVDDHSPYREDREDKSR